MCLTLAAMLSCLFGANENAPVTCNYLGNFDRPKAIIHSGITIYTSKQLRDDPLLHLPLSCLSLGADGVNLINEQDTRHATLWIWTTCHVTIR